MIKKIAVGILREGYFLWGTIGIGSIVNVEWERGYYENCKFIPFKSYYYASTI